MGDAVRFAVITGAAGGIGRALVSAFTDAGYRVIATDRVPPSADLLCHLYLAADLDSMSTDPEFAEEILTRVRACVGAAGVAALINNAAVQILGGGADLDRADWQQTLNVNLLAPFFWIQGLLPELEVAQGAVVNVSSIHARMTKPHFVAYATSKAALSGLTRALAVDLGHRIRINAIEPAAIATEMLKAGFQGHPESYSRLESCHPTRSVGTPAEVAQLALALADRRLAFANGACVPLDGGIGARLHDPE